MWLPDSNIPQVIRGILGVFYDGGVELWKVGIGKIRLREEDMQPPQ